MTDQDEIRKARDRIGKLLNMTVERGATEDEAANAMRLAAGIAARLGIELESVKPRDGSAPKPTIAQKHTDLQMKPYEAFCAEAAGMLYGVECVAPNLGKHGFYYTGREENIALAEQTMLWLVRQVELLYKQHLPKGLTKKARSDFRNSFKDACAQRVLERARELIRNMKTQDNAAQDATGRNAVVVAGYFDTLRTEIDTWRNDKHKAVLERSDERIRQRAEARTQQLALMSEPERVAFLQAGEDRRLENERENKKYAKAQERRWARQSYKEPRQRNIRRGSGSGVGRQAGDSVQMHVGVKHKPNGE